MRIDGLAFVLAELDKVQHGLCPGCDQPLPPLPERTRDMTCNDTCSARWIDRLVAELGPTKVLTLRETGKRYVVPTRVILEHGIKASDLPTYPEAP